MTFEPTPSQQQQHQAWKAAKARLMNTPLLKPKLIVVNPEPPPPTEEELRRQLMDCTISAVANVAGLPPVEVLEGYPTVEVCNARNLAMGLCAFRYRMKEPDIAEYFGVHQKAVTNAAKSLCQISIELSLSTRTPLELVLPAIWPRWIAVLHVTSIVDIQSAVCQRWEVAKVDLISSRRSAYVLIPRQAAMALCKKITPYSYPEIGRRFGGKDHTTVIHAVQKFKSRMDMIDLPPLSPVLSWVNKLHEVLQEHPFEFAPRKNKEAVSG